MMLGGGRSPRGTRLRHDGDLAMSARITASVYTSHVPAIGAAMDTGKTDEPYWRPLFAGYEPSEPGWPTTPRCHRLGLQRSRHRVQPRPHTQRSPSAPRRISRSR